MEDKIEIYPNPAKNNIYITLHNSGFPVLLEIVNMQGQVLSSSKLISDSDSVNITNLKAGIYMYRISKNGERIKSGKLIVE